LHDGDLSSGARQPWSWWWACMPATGGARSAPQRRVSRARRLGQSMPGHRRPPTEYRIWCGCSAICGARPHHDSYAAGGGKGLTRGLSICLTAWRADSTKGRFDTRYIGDAEWLVDATFGAAPRGMGGYFGWFRLNERTGRIVTWDGSDTGTPIEEMTRSCVNTAMEIWNGVPFPTPVPTSEPLVPPLLGESFSDGLQRRLKALNTREAA